MLGLTFIVEALGDYLSCMWHDARENGRIATQVVISMFLQALTWIPIWFAIQTEDWRIAMISIVGTGFGTMLGALRVKKRKAVKDRAVVTDAPGRTPSLDNRFWH